MLANHWASVEEAKHIHLDATESMAEQTLTRMQEKKKNTEGSLQEFITILFLKRCNFNLFICTYIQITTAF